MSSQSKGDPPPPTVAKNVEDGDSASDISGANSVMFEFNVQFTNMENNIRGVRQKLQSLHQEMFRIHGDVVKLISIQEVDDENVGPVATLDNNPTTNYSYYNLDQKESNNIPDLQDDDISTLSSRIGRNFQKKAPELISKSIQILHFSIFSVLFCTFAWIFSFAKNVGVNQSILEVLPLASCPLCAVTSYYNILSVRQLRELESIVLSESSFVLVIASFTVRIIKNSIDHNNGSIAMDAGSLLVFVVLGVVNLVLSLQYNQYLGSKPRHEEIEEKFLVN